MNQAIHRPLHPERLIPIFFMVAVGSGFLCLFMSLLLSGEGHGWYAPLYVSWIAVIAGPLSMVAVVARNSRAGFVLTLVLMMVAVIADAWLYLNGGRSEAYGDSFRHAMAMGPGWVFLWLITWLFWQGIAVYALRVRFAVRSDS